MKRADDRQTTDEFGDESVFNEVFGLNLLQRGTDLALGIGIEAGYATLGRIGFEGRYDYGALGPVTNLASRLSTRAMGGQILIGPRVFAATEVEVEATPLGDLELKGFARATPTYEVQGLRPPPL